MKSQINEFPLTKADFEKWYSKKYSYADGAKIFLQIFHEMDLSFQWGVYLKYFETHEICVDMISDLGGGGGCIYYPTIQQMVYGRGVVEYPITFDCGTAFCSEIYKVIPVCLFEAFKVIESQLNKDTVFHAC